MKDRMMHGGLAKLVEELGECGQVVGKMLQFPDVEYHPDSATFENPKTLHERLEEEMADVMASIEYVCAMHGLSKQAITDRARSKLTQYYEWGKEGET